MKGWQLPVRLRKTTINKLNDPSPAVIYLPPGRSWQNIIED